MTAPVLDAGRVVLRPPTPDDRDAVYAYASEPDFFRYVEVPRSVSEGYRREHAAAHLEELLRNARRGYPAWAVEHGGDVVGMVRFRPGPGGTPELGYALARAARGRGLATEAVTRVLEHADGLWRETVARCHRDHAASLRLLERVGYRSDGTEGDMLWFWRPRAR